MISVCLEDSRLVTKDTFSSPCVLIFGCGSRRVPPRIGYEGVPQIPSRTTGIVRGDGPRHSGNGPLQPRAHAAFPPQRAATLAGESSRSCWVSSSMFASFN